MMRFLVFLFGKQYEPCKSCEVLKQQLAIANAEKKELVETLLGLLKPKVYESPPTELQPIVPKLGMFSRRRAMLEEQDRETARVQSQSRFIAQSDKVKTASNSAVEELEAELGIEEETGNASR